MWYLIPALLAGALAAAVAVQCLTEARAAKHRRRKLLGRLRARAPDYTAATAAQELDLAAANPATRQHEPAATDRLEALLDSLPILGKQRLAERRRHLARSYSAELPRMLEVLALGLRTGLGFDQAFALYVHRFETPLARACLERFTLWERGLVPREQGLRELAAQIDLAMFNRFAATAVRSLNYGAPMTELLLSLADETRKAYRASQQELIAKAPVKMLLPTGALILPAMLLLVIGPILLDLVGRMG